MAQEKKRREDARSAASEYAPNPTDSAMVYGLIGVALGGVALWVLSKFYGLDVLQHPVLLSVGAGAVFVLSVGLRKWRRRRHRAAYRRELEQGSAPVERPSS